MTIRQCLSNMSMNMSFEVAKLNFSNNTTKSYSEHCSILSKNLATSCLYQSHLTMDAIYRLKDEMSVNLTLK